MARFSAGATMIFLPLLLLLNSTAFAETKFTANPDIELTNIYYPEARSPDKNDHEIFTMKVPGTVRFSKTSKFRFNPELSADPENASKSERYFADPSEAYFQWQQNPITVQLGWNTFNWGDTDVFNPLDVVNPRRYQDPLRSEKLGSPSAFVRWDHGALSVEGVYVIEQRKSILPGENSRWLPRDVYQSRSFGSSFGTVTAILPTNINYNYMEPIDLDNALSNNFGARIKAKFSGLDISLVGFEGTAASPVVGLRQVTGVETSLTPLVLVVQPNVVLQATYYKVQVAGASFVKVLGDYLLKGESAFSRPVSRRNDLPRQGFDNVLALERSFDVGTNTLTSILGATYADHHEALDNGTTSLSRMFDKSGLLALRFTAGTRWTLLASFLRDVKYKGNFFRGETTWKATDTITFDLMADVIGGSVGTPLGTYRNNDRLILGATLKF